MTGATTASGLKIEGLACIRGESVLFRTLSFAVAPGEALLIRGANGSGKSSLLRILAGLLTPLSGTVALDGSAIGDDLHAYRRQLAYLGHLDGLKAAETPREALSFRFSVIPVSNAGIHNPEPASSVYGVTPSGRNDDLGLGLVGMQSHIDTPIRYLSAGQKRRVALAGVLASGARLWLLDEPTTALDEAAFAQVQAVLAAHVACGGMVVAATHDALPNLAARTLTLGAA